MPECALDDRLPSGAVEKSGFGAERSRIHPIVSPVVAQVNERIGSNSYEWMPMRSS